MAQEPYFECYNIILKNNKVSAILWYLKETAVFAFSLLMVEIVKKMQHCCISRYNSVAFKISVINIKRATAVSKDTLQYLKILQYCITNFLDYQGKVDAKVLQVKRPQYCSQISWFLIYNMFLLSNSFKSI